MNETPNQTEAESIAELALDAAGTEDIVAQPGDVGTLIYPSGSQMWSYDHENLLDNPRRAKATKFRITEGALRVRYLLTRPHEVIRTAFDDVVDVVEHGVGLVAFRGTPPA